MSVKLDRKFVLHALTDMDMTIRELAKRAGVGEATMYRIMSGGSFNTETLGKIARALNVNPIDLLDTEGYPSPHVDAPATEAQVA